MPITKWAGIAVALAATSVSAAQSYPNKPVRVIFAFAAGGAGDIVARAYGQKFAGKFGQGWVLDIKRDIARWKRVVQEANIRL